MNLGQMVTQVCDRLNVRPTNAAVVRQITTQLNASYATIRALRNWDWLIGSVARPITAATTAVALPADCRSVFHVSLRSQGLVLEYRDVTVAEIESGALTFMTRTDPAAWTTIGGSLYTIPLPGGADTLDILYYRAAPDLVLNTDTPLLPADHHQLLVEDCIASMAAQDQYDPLVPRAAWTRRNELLRALMHTGRKASPHVAHIRMLGTPDQLQH